QCELVVGIDDFSLRPLDGPGCHGEVHQADVADIQTNPAVTRHQVGLLLGGVQADSDGGDVRHRIDHALAVLQGNLGRVVVAGNCLDCKLCFALEVQTTVGQNAGKVGRSAVNDVFNDCYGVAHGYVLSSGASSMRITTRAPG